MNKNKNKIDTLLRSTDSGPLPQQVLNWKKIEQYLAVKAINLKKRNEILRKIRKGQHKTVSFSDIEDHLELCNILSTIEQQLSDIDD